MESPVSNTAAASDAGYAAHPKLSEVFPLAVESNFGEKISRRVSGWEANGTAPEDSEKSTSLETEADRARGEKVASRTQTAQNAASLAMGKAESRKSDWTKIARSQLGEPARLGSENEDLIGSKEEAQKPYVAVGMHFAGVFPCGA